MGMDLRAIPDPTRTRRPAVQLYHPPSQPPSRPDTSIGFARVTVGGGEDRHATPAPSVGRTASAWPRGGRMAPQVDRFCQLCQLGYITWVGGSRSLLEKQAILAYKLKLHVIGGKFLVCASFRGHPAAAPLTLEKARAHQPRPALPRPSGRGPIDAACSTDRAARGCAFCGYPAAAPLTLGNRHADPFRTHPSAAIRPRPH